MNLKVVISVAILAILVTQVDYTALAGKLAQADWRLSVAALSLILAQIYFLNLRWHALLNAGRNKIDRQTSGMINIAGFLANTLFISAIGGIVTKSALSIRSGITVIHALTSTFLDRAFTFLALVFCSFVCLPFLFGVLNVKLFTMLCVATLLILVSCALGYALLQNGKFKKFIFSNRKRARFTATFRSLSEDRTMIASTLVYSLIAQSLYIAAVYVLSLEFNFAGNPIEFIAILPILTFISSLPISFGGWGVREGSFIYGLGLLGFASEDAFLLSVQIGLITLIAPFIASVPYLVGYNSQKFSAFLHPHKTNIN